MRYGQADAVLHGSGILTPDILRRELNVEHGGADVSVSHQLLESGQGDSGPNHIGSKGVSKPVRIGTRDLTAQAMMAEQRAESGYSQGLSAVAAFQGNEQSR